MATPKPDGFYPIFSKGELQNLQGRTRVPDALTKNMFSLLIENTPLSGDFIELMVVQSYTAPSATVGTAERGDGRTGRIFNFNDGSKDFGTLTITAVRDPNDPFDYLLMNKVNDFMQNGTKLDGKVIKYHYAGAEVFSIIFKGLTFYKQTKPALAKTESGLYEETFECGVDFWYEN